MKKGDIVTVNDFSWFDTVGTDTCDYAKDCAKHYRILDIECHFPLTYGQPKKYRSDTTVQAIDSGEVLIIHGAFLKLVPPKHKIMIDIRTGGGLVTGQYIEISDKLYKEIKHEAKG